MSPAIPLSELASRTTDSPISDLMTRALSAPDLVSLAAGFVDPATLPVEAVGQMVAEILSQPADGRQALQYGTTQGGSSLRARLLRLIEASEDQEEGAFEAYLDRLIVTTGSQQLLYLVCEALLDPGDIVLVEAPTYFVFMGVLQSRGAKVIGVPTDSDGLRIDALESTLADLEAREKLDRVKLIYTISEHSNPTGLSLVPERRKALVDLAKSWSKRQRIFILEDAAYRGLTFEGTEPSSVWGHDSDGQTVIHARTLSKTFAPGLRTGFGILPEPLVQPILNLKGSHDFGSAHFPQRILDRVLAEGLYAPQVNRVAEAYRSKCQVMLEAIDEQFGQFGESVSWTRPKGGLYVWMTLPEGVDTGRDGAFFEACLAEGVLYVPGAFAYPELPGPFPNNQARLTFGYTTEEQIVEGVGRLARALGRVWSKSEQPARHAGSPAVLTGRG